MTDYRFVGLDEHFVPDTFDLADFRTSGTIVAAQEIPEGWLDRVKAKRDRQDSQTFAQLTKGDDIEKVHLARIPVAVVNKWAREGFDLYGLISSGAPNAAAIIMARLRAEDLQAFATTSKRF